MTSNSRHHQFVISRRAPGPAGTDDGHHLDAYGLWRFDPDADEMLTAMPLAPGARLDRRHQLVQIGNFLLEWGPQVLTDDAPSFAYRLFCFDPASLDPLGLPAADARQWQPSTAVASGLWPKTKFWQYRADFGNPGGGREGWENFDSLTLIPVGSWLLQLLPAPGRCTFGLWNVDPQQEPGKPSDPLTALYQPMGSFDVIDQDHQLIVLGNYVLDWVPKTGDYRVLSFDPQNPMPLASPAVQQGRFSDNGAERRLVAIGELVLDWNAVDRSYRLWRFDPKAANPLCGPVRSGTLPAGLDAHTVLLGVLPRLPLPSAASPAPGSMEFMRAKIKHVVYLMLENRSFDHVCGWLYEQEGQGGISFVGHDRPFAGASTQMFNIDPDTGAAVHLSQYLGGELPAGSPLEFLPSDPYHDTSDVLRQCFGADGSYAARAQPAMKGFVWNNRVHEVMMTYTPNQLPVLNGLGRQFAISDEWFCSTPGPTDPNRAFAFTGSSLGELNNFQNGNLYAYWPAYARRQSLWKVLWSQGVTDWKMYYTVEWENFVHTYHLFMDGQIPSVDRNPSRFIAPIEHFKADARSGKLPAFSYLEPAWISAGGTTSYHPGADPGVGERELADLYAALRAGPGWNETLFIINFDEHGGIFDHVAPSYVEKPWPHDSNDGFQYDMLGPRVPAILVSPWIEPGTVFRSRTNTPFDHTSVLATVLNWFGVPRANWALGDRVHHAPTFETALQRETPRTDAPATLGEPGPREPAQAAAGLVPVTSLEREMASRIVWHLVKDKLAPPAASQLTQQILADSPDLASLHRAIQGISASQPLTTSNRQEF